MGSRPAAFALTREDTNFYRLKRLIEVYGCVVLRDIFDRKCPPDRLRSRLLRNREKLKDLHRKGVLGTKQWRKLYPEQGSPESSNFDISLLVILLRNICYLRESDHYWENHLLYDNEPEINIARLRDYRNKFSHPSNPSLDDAEFEEYWAKISSAIIVLGGRENYASAISQLKTSLMDPEAETLSQELQKTKQKLGHLKEMMKSHEASTSGSFRKMNGMLMKNQKTTEKLLKEVSVWPKIH